MHFYRNGNFIVGIASDGTKIRRTDESFYRPSFAENVDMKITDKCSICCEFCYEGCSPRGEHANLFNYEFINNLHPYTEVAINGNDLDHPQISRFLGLLAAQKVFCNVTVHQRQFLANFDRLNEFSKNGLIHGIGVSLSEVTEELIKKMQEIPNCVLHIINGIITDRDIFRLENHDLKLLILGYKRLQRGDIYYFKNCLKVIDNQTRLKRILPSLIESKSFKVISFDNLAIEQLGVKSLLTPKQWNEFYMGDDGQFTFYIDMVKGEFAKNSLATERYKIGNKTIDEMFNIIRNENNTEFYF